MDPLSNVDRLTLILRQRLKEGLGKSAGSAQAAPLRDAHQQQYIGPAQGAKPSSSIEGLGGANSSDAARVVVQHILQEGLGSEYINDLQFQSLVDRVLEAIQSDDDARMLLDRTVAGLV